MNTLIGTKRILVVDDERTVCASVEKMLTRQGHMIEKAQSVPEAVALLDRALAFDLIIADLMMPAAGGLDLLRTVKERRLGIPLLIMTGYASIGSAIEATRLGATGYLPKPFTPDELQVAIERATTLGGALMGQKPAAQVSRPASGPAAAPMPARTEAKAKGPIDVDMPFSLSDVSAATSEAYAHALGRGDMPVTGRWDPKRASGRRVLVVDDEAVVVNSIRRTLTRRGYVVDEAFSANEALNRILNDMYDLVLLDMKMPDANGLELLPTIRKHRPGLPVVIVTGYASIDTAVEAIRRGARDYMAKPFTPDELYATASRALRAGGV